MSSIEFRDVVKRFGENEVIPRFSLEIPTAQLTVLLGPSGCGKSTLLRLIAGLESPDEGKILIAGEDVTDLEPRKRQVAMVFQNYALYPHLTIRENISFPLKVARVSKEEIKQRVESVAEMLGLSPMLDRYPKTLSGGERQRTALGRAIVRKPRLFLFDEPLSNLDFQLRNQMRTELVALQRKLGKTTLYVTHDQTEGMTMADTLVVLRGGKIMQVGRPDEIYNRPANVFTAQFIGSPRMNVFPAKVLDGKLYTAEGHCLCDVSYPEGEYQVGIRPDHLQISTDGDGIKAKPQHSEFHGATHYLTCTMGGIDLCARAGSELHDLRQPVYLNFEPEHLHFFEPGSFSRIE